MASITYWGRPAALGAELVTGGFEMKEFEAFFERATGHRPHGYQARVAREGLPAVVEAPT